MVWFSTRAIPKNRRRAGAYTKSFPNKAVPQGALRVPGHQSPRTNPQNAYGLASATVTSTSAGFTQVTRFGKQATRSWNDSSAKATKATDRDFNVPCRWKCMGRLDSL